MRLPFNVSVTEYNKEITQQKKIFKGYIDVVFPEQTSFLNNTSKLDSFWLNLMAVDEENNAFELRKFNTIYNNYTCYSIDTSFINISTPETYQYIVKSMAWITETFSVPNEKGYFDNYDIEMIDYETTVVLNISDRERIFAINSNNLTLEVGNVYNVEICKYK